MIHISELIFYRTSSWRLRGGSIQFEISENEIGVCKKWDRGLFNFGFKWEGGLFNFITTITMKKAKQWDKCRICGEKFEKKANRLWCAECRKEVDRTLKEMWINFLLPKYK